MKHSSPRFRLRGGVIGFGNIGRALTHFLREKKSETAEITTVFDPDLTAQQLAKRDFGLAAATDLDGFWHRKLDFVIIASISSAHAEHVCRAADAGCHVFCEKPLALTLHDADQAIAAVERAGIINQVNYSLRYIEAYRRLRAWVEGGRFGQLLSVAHARTRGYGLHTGGAKHPAVLQPDQTGGWAVHHACHGLDLLYWLNGSFTSIAGLTATTAPNRAEEAVQAVLTFANGSIGHVSDSVCGLREHHTQIIGSAGSAILTGEHEHTSLRFRPEGAGAVDKVVPVQDVKNHGIAFDEFFSCIQTSTPSRNSLRDARPSLEAALGLQESAKSRQIVALGQAMRPIKGA